MVIDSRKAQPPEEARGRIARTYKYMDWAYPNRGVISKKNRKLIEAWDKSDPVSASEKKRAEKIEKALSRCRGAKGQL